MDPNETLRIMRQAVKAWEQAPSGSREENEAAERATSAASALDDWLSRGGFPPEDWRQAFRPRIVVTDDNGVPLDIDTSPAAPGPEWVFPDAGR